MQMESLGRMLPAIVFPYVQQWAERAGLPLLSQLLVDEQFRALLEKYGDEMMKQMAASAPAEANGHVNGKSHASGNGYANGNGHANGTGHASEIVPLVTQRPMVDETGPDRAIEQTQQALFELLRIKIRPLALALGCCPECLVGIDGCPTCWGQSKVGYYPPDQRLLEAAIVNPLAARGVLLVLNEGKTKQPNASRKRSRSWPRK